MIDIERSLEVWQSSLCKEVPEGGLFARSSIAHKWKAPWRIMLLREAAAWRAVDLMTQSVALYKLKHILGARVLLRSAFETLAVLVYSSQEMRRVVAGQVDFHVFSEKSSRLLLGSRDGSTHHSAINVVTVLGKANARIPGISRWYEALSESAHPNFEGLLLGYSTSDASLSETRFENRWDSLYGGTHMQSVEACMAVFELEYNHEWPEAFERLEIWIEANDAMLEASKPT